MRCSQTLGADPRPQLAPPQYRLDLNCWNDSNHIAEPQFAYAGAQLGVGTVARIVQHDTARYAGRTSRDEAVRKLPQVLALDRRTVRRRFEQRFSAARMAKDYVRVYRSLLKRQPPLERAAVISRLDPDLEKGMN